MSTLEQRKKIYINSIIQKNYQDFNKLRPCPQKTMSCMDEMELVKLTEEITNWETYLTDIQLEVTKLFLSCRNTRQIDLQRKKVGGTAWHILFGEKRQGCDQKYGGALGNLKKAKLKIEQ